MVTSGFLHSSRNSAVASNPIKKETANNIPNGMLTPSFVNSPGVNGAPAASSPFPPAWSTPKANARQMTISVNMTQKSTFADSSTCR
ncbi:hypothetical protein D3C81_1217910 [compost metagenome]